MPIVPIIMIILCLGALGGLFFYKKQDKATAIKISQDKMTANEFVNVKDIKDKFLYTLDGHIITYLKITPISIDLLSDNEKKTLKKILTAELSSINEMFKFLAVSRPVDIAPLINDYSDILSSTTDPIQKDLLRNEMMAMSNYALSGEVVERQFYIMLWDVYEPDIEKELAKRAYEFQSRLESGKVRCNILKQQEIARLCNLINNPSYVHFEDLGYEPSFSMFKS